MQTYMEHVDTKIVLTQAGILEGSKHQTSL
jgi:hypothetical protein